MKGDGPDKIVIWMLLQSKDLILSQIHGADKQQQYREKAQRYSDEHRRIWKDIRHGFIYNLDSGNTFLCICIIPYGEIDGDYSWQVKRLNDIGC